MADPTKAQAWAIRDTRSLIEAWVAVWNTYDLDALPSLFVDDERLSYFSSEKPGLIHGYPAVLAHHRGFGFLEGGKVSQNKLWLEEVASHDLGGATLTTAIWFFQRPDGSGQWGPVTLVSVPGADHPRFLHLQFANYPKELRPASKG